MLACATVCGVFFLLGVYALAWIYFHLSPHQLPLKNGIFAEISLFGVGLLCFGIAYLILARKPSPPIHKSAKS
jgi:hypothetical protein